MRWSTAFTCIAIAAEILLALPGAGCASSGSSGLETSRKEPASAGSGGRAVATSVAEIEVLADVNEITRAYRMVGYVEAERLADSAQERVGVRDLLPVLKERARQLGAQALIELETRPLEKEGRRGLKATAIAIVFTD